MDPGGDDTLADAGASGGSSERDSRAEERDRAAEARDSAAQERDESAEGREQAANERDELADRVGPTRHPDRAGAPEDRAAAASDREYASDDRDSAAGDRSAANSTIKSLLHDELTGAYQRNEGLTELEREVVKARRTGEPMTLAFIDVDRLKATNGTGGHLAGDRLLMRVVAAIRSVVREYDVVVRYGGDEFLCGALGLTLADARSRFDRLNACMAETGGGTASAGVVQLEEGEDLAQLIARADAALFHRKPHPA